MFQLSISLGSAQSGVDFDVAQRDSGEAWQILTGMRLSRHFSRELEAQPLRQPDGPKFKSQHEVLQEHVGRLHMSIEAIAHSLEQLNYSVCKMKDPHDEMGEQRSIRSIGPVMKLRTGTVQSLVQIAVCCFARAGFREQGHFERSDADSGLQAKYVCFPWVFLRCCCVFLGCLAQVLGAKLWFKPEHLKNHENQYMLRVIMSYGHSISSNVVILPT